MRTKSGIFGNENYKRIKKREMYNSFRLGIISSND